MGWWWLPVIAAFLVAGLFIWQNLVVGRANTPIPSVTVTRTVPRTSTASTPATTSAAPTTSTAPTTTPVKTVTLVESDYVGQTTGVVRADLTTLGFLDITTKSVPSDRPKGEVLGITPTGSVPVTTTIVITVSAGAAPTASSTAGGTSG